MFCHAVFWASHLRLSDGERPFTVIEANLRSRFTTPGLFHFFSTITMDVRCQMSVKNGPRECICTTCWKRGYPKTGYSTTSGIQLMLFINESGLYSLILSSKLESARRFKHWVTSEVLPSIRKQGGYMVLGAAFPFSYTPIILIIWDGMKRPPPTANRKMMPH